MQNTLITLNLLLIKMSKKMVVVVFLLCALILSTNPAQAAKDCLSVVNNILSCKNNLENPTPISRGTQQCCDALRNIDSDSDVGKCLEQSPSGPAFLPSKARLLPSICNLPGLSSLVNSIAPETETDSILGKFRPKTPKAPPAGSKPPKTPRFQFPPITINPEIPLPIPVPSFQPAQPIPVPSFQPAQPIPTPGIQPAQPIPTPGFQPPQPIPPQGPVLLPPPSTIPTPPLDPALLTPTTPELPASPPAAV